MPIDFSKINLSVLPKGGNVVKSPSRTKAPLGGRIDYGAIKLGNIYTATKTTPKPVAPVKSSASFIGRPLVTPVEQQRMKATAPKPTSRLSLWVNGKTVEQRTLEGKQMTAALAGKSLFDGFKEGVDSYNNATAKGFMGSAAPAEGGITGNRWVDLTASLATMGAVIQTGVQVVGGLVSAINFTRAMNSKWNWPTVEGGVASNDLAVRVAQANPKLDEGTASSIAALVARTGGNTAQLNALASNTSTLSRSLNQMSLAARNPSTALNIIPSAARVIAQTGIFQAIPMPAGLVHSTAPAIPMGEGTQPALPRTSPSIAISQPQVSPTTPEPVIAPVVAPASVTRPIQAPAVKSYADIMAKEEEMGAALNTNPRAVDKTIPALDIKKANLVDVTAKVDLKSVQVKFPAADKVVLDTKRRTVMFMHGTTPLEAIGVDKPQLQTWYGIEGAKLLGEITRPVVAQVAPPLSKMETPAADIIKSQPDPQSLYGTTVTVRGTKIGKHQDPDWQGTIQETVNDGDIVVVDRGGTAGSVRVNASDIASIDHLITNKIEPTSATAKTPKMERVRKSPAQDFRTASEWADYAKRKGATTARDAFNVYVKDGLMSGTTPRAMFDMKDMIKAWEGSTPMPDSELYTYQPVVTTPDLATTPQKGTATTISNQKTSISTSTPVSPRGGTKTGAGAVKWGKWIDAVGSRRTDGVGGGDVETIKTPITYRLSSGLSPVRAYAPTKAADKGISGPFVPETGKRLELKGDSHTYYITQKSEADAIAEGNPSYRPFSVLEASSGNLIGWGSKVKDAIGNAQETINNFREIYPNRVKQAVADHGEIANPIPTSVGTPASVPPALITSTSAPASAPAIGNAAPAHGLIDYSRIELNGTTYQTPSKVLASVGNTGKRSRIETKGFDNYIQNTAGTKDTSLSPEAKFKQDRDALALRFVNDFGGLMKTPLGAEWMTLAIEADEVVREEYTRPFSISEAGERVYVEGEFGPAILNRYLKESDVVKERYLRGPDGKDLVGTDGKKIPNPNHGKPQFGIFLQHLQRAGMSTEPTLGLSAEKEALKQKHIYDARMNLVNFQKNDPQLFTKYMSQANELGNANALLAEFYKGIISPETYANDKANPHYYVSLSAGKTDKFDRSGVAPLEHARGLTNLDEVVDPLPGLIAVYVDAIRAQGINNAKKEAVRSNPNSEVATTELSDSIVHLKENGVDRAYDVHDTSVTKSVKNLTLPKPEVTTVEKLIVKNPTTVLRLFATGLNPAFGLYNIVRDAIQAVGTVPFTPKGLVKGTLRAFESPQLSQWFESYRDPMMSKGVRATEAVKMVLKILTFPNEIGESLTRSVIAESILDRGGTYLDQLHGYYASTGFFALHGTFFNDFLPSCIPFVRATIAVVRSAYRNTFLGLPIGGKGGTFSWKQGTEKMAGRHLATIIFAIIGALAWKEAGREKEYKLLRNRASYFYFPLPKGGAFKLSVPIGLVPIKGITDYLLGYGGDPTDVAKQTVVVLPGLENFFLPPAAALLLQFKYNINFFTGAAMTAAVGTPAANPLEAALMKTGMDEGQAAFLVRSFLADIPSQVQYVFQMVTQGTSTQSFPLTKRFIVKDPTTSSNAAVDDFYALVDAAKRSKNPALESFVNARANAVGDLLHNAKLYPENAKTYIAGATDFIIATFALIAENPDVYGIKKYGPFSWRPSGNYEELAP